MFLTRDSIEAIIFAKLMQDEASRSIITSTVKGDFFSHKGMRKTYEESMIPGDYDELSFKLHVNGVESSLVSELSSVDISGIDNDEMMKFQKDVYANRILIDGLKRSIDNPNYKDNLAELRTLQEMVEEINDDSSGITMPNEALDLYMAQLEENRQRLIDNPGGTIGISTGSDKLDAQIEGVGHQDYILIGARPSMGKTSMVIKLILAGILKHDKVVVMFSLETPIQDMLARIISQVNTDIQLKQSLFGRDVDFVMDDIKEVVALLRKKKLYIEDFHKSSRKEAVKPSPAVFAEKLRKIIEIEGDIGLVVVDHIGLMSASVPGLAEGNPTVTSISRELRMMTRQFNCPFTVLSQLNRELEKRVDKRPKLSDLRDSGALEQDADKIIFIYREYNYRREELKEMIKQKPNDQSLIRALAQLMSQTHDAAEYIVSKNRNGPLGTIDVTFERATASFHDERDLSHLDDMFDAPELYVQG